MFRSTPSRAFVNYLAAGAASVAAVAIVGGLQPVLGYVPMLLLLVVAGVAVMAGVGPAALSLVICFLGALLLTRSQGFNDDYLHNIANLIAFPLVAGALMYLIERRRRDRWLDFEFSVLLGNMPEAVMVVDRRGRVVQANRAALQLTGFTPHQLATIRLPELAQKLGARLDGDSLNLSELAVSRALGGQIIRDEPRVLKAANGEDDVEALVSATPIRDGSDDVVGAMVVIRDVTEVSALQRRVADTERHRAIGQMAAGIAHDFNNVLDTIGQAVAVMELRQDADAGQRQRYLGIINNSVRRGAEIINRVREYIRGGTGEMRLLDISQIMNEAAELTLPLLRREERKITVVRELKSGIKVFGNAADLRRAFANLIINAVEAMPNGGTLTLWTEMHHSRVIASVRDTGEGIAREQQSKIFSPYFTTKAEGTGLGLSGAQRIINAHGGDIRFQSETGRGTVFYVELPASVGKESEGQQQAA